MIHLIAGARPNFMKIAPIVRELKRQKIPYGIIHTGQHYDYEMSESFFKDLEIPQPDYYLGAGSGTHAEQTAKIMVEYEKICVQDMPDLCMVVGDVNSTLACSIMERCLVCFNRQRWSSGRNNSPKGSVFNSKEQYRKANNSRDRD